MSNEDLKEECGTNKTRGTWKWSLLKLCCASGIKETKDLFRPQSGCHGHHSLYVQPEAIQSASHTGVAVVYRPPQLNQRLAPGESRPRFWINPGPGSTEPAVVSVAWCELCKPACTGVAKCRSANNKKSRSRDAGHKRPKLSPIGEDGMEGDFLDQDDIYMSGDNNIVVTTYPAFLKPYINKCIRLKLTFTDTKTQQVIGAHYHLRHDGESQPMQETSHLVRTVHSLRLHLRYSSIVRGLPEILLDENHGGNKRLRKVRYRHMSVGWIDLDHRGPRIVVVGDAFQLSLYPPCPLQRPEDFPDGNGEIPAVVGEYMRTLDTAPDQRLRFSVHLYQWYNQATPSTCSSHNSAVNMEAFEFK